MAIEINTLSDEKIPYKMNTRIDALQFNGKINEFRAEWKEGKEIDLDKLAELVEPGVLKDIEEARKLIIRMWDIVPGEDGQAYRDRFLKDCPTVNSMLPALILTRGKTLFIAKDEGRVIGTLSSSMLRSTMTESDIAEPYRRLFSLPRWDVLLSSAFVLDEYRDGRVFSDLVKTAEDRASEVSYDEDQYYNSRLAEGEPLQRSSYLIKFNVHPEQETFAQITEGAVRKGFHPMPGHPQLGEGENLLWFGKIVSPRVSRFTFRR